MPPALRQSISTDHGCCVTEVCGAELILDPAGIAYWPSEKLLMVADLHLEKGSAIARKGQLVPPYDSHKTLQRLEAAINQWNPLRVVALGDSFHDVTAAERLPLELHRQLKLLTSSREWLWIAGNHDPFPSIRIEGEQARSVVIGRLHLCHEPQARSSLADKQGEIAGHLHPKARIIRKGRSVRRACFIADSRRMILPSFGAFTGGLCVLHEVFHDIFARREFSAYLLGTNQVYQIPGANLS